MPTYFKFTHLLFENVYIVSVIEYFDYLILLLNNFFPHWNLKNSNILKKLLFYAIDCLMIYGLVKIPKMIIQAVADYIIRLHKNILNFFRNSITMSNVTKTSPVEISTDSSVSIPDMFNDFVYSSSDQMLKIHWRKKKETKTRSKHQKEKECWSCWNT